MFKKFFLSLITSFIENMKIGVFEHHGQRNGTSRQLKMLKMSVVKMNQLRLCCMKRKRRARILNDPGIADNP